MTRWPSGQTIYWMRLQNCNYCGSLLHSFFSHSWCFKLLEYSSLEKISKKWSKNLLHNNYLTIFSFKKGLEVIGERMSEFGAEYAYNDEYGFLLTCPSGIGTAIRAGVHMKLPNLLRVSELHAFYFTSMYLFQRNFIISQLIRSYIKCINKKNLSSIIKNEQTLKLYFAKLVVNV